MEVILVIAEGAKAESLIIENIQKRSNRKI